MRWRRRTRTMTADGGQVHAVAWFKHAMWSWGWYPVCTGEYMHGDRPEKTRERELKEKITCQPCLKQVGTLTETSGSSSR